MINLKEHILKTNTMISEGYGKVSWFVATCMGSSLLGVVISDLSPKGSSAEHDDTDRSIRHDILLHRKDARAETEVRL